MKKNYIAPTVQVIRLASTNLLATSIEIVDDAGNITNSDLNQSDGAWSIHRNGSIWNEETNNSWPY